MRDTAQIIKTYCTYFKTSELGYRNKKKLDQICWDLYKGLLILTEILHTVKQGFG